MVAQHLDRFLPRYWGNGFGCFGVESFDGLLLFLVLYYLASQSGRWNAPLYDRFGFCLSWAVGFFGGSS